MKRFLAILLLNTLIIQVLSAQSRPRAYFCTTQGMTLRYERYDSSGKHHWWTQTTRINRMRTRDDGAIELDVSTTVDPDKEHAPFKGPVSSMTVLHPDGTIEVNMTEVAAAVAHKMFSALDFKASGGSSFLKNTARPGDVLDEIHGTVDWNGIKMSLDFTERIVLRRETITVPGGTFDCIVVKEHKLEKYPLHKRDRITYTWYTLDYGLVRHDTYFLDGKKECSECLYEIRR